MESGKYESDHLGDMTRLAVCKRAATQFVGLIPNDATFELITFNWEYEVCDLGGSELTSVQKKRKASKWIDKITADGGTELHHALNYVYSNASPIKNTVIILITDGSINRTTEVFRLIQKNPMISIFSLGVSNNVSQYLIKGVAARSGGRSAYVGSGETDNKTVQKKVHELMNHAKTSLRKQLAIYDLVFKCESTPTFVSEPQPLYEKVDNTLYAFTETPVTAIEFSMIETLNGEKVTKTQTIIPKELTDCDFLLHKIGGGKLIRNLETKIKSESKRMKIVKPSPVLEESGKPVSSPESDETTITEFNTNLKNDIIEVSTDLGILSKYTAFIAVEHILNPDTGEMVFCEIPLQAQDNDSESEYNESSGIQAECASGGVQSEGTSEDRDPYRIYREPNENAEVEEDEDDGDKEVGNGEDSQTNATIKPDFSVDIDLGGVDLGGFITTERNVSLRTLVDFDFQEGNVIQLRNQANVKLNGFYEIINLGSDDEPWLLERIN